MLALADPEQALADPEQEVAGSVPEALGQGRGEESEAAWVAGPAWAWVWVPALEQGRELHPVLQVFAKPAAWNCR